ncbi:MAG TPA: DUF1631 family protein [Polaromonas sp.]|uniref:DUF1631 family protein n=1 Tax=Polaromonas sp. TaxID=1869339 RepID=UPI002D6C1402|nr:DUF1631 family protein [Polaromonas sp.]HYW58386.1 DUF1631 family protein [Polaromonas sp.]
MPAHADVFDRCLREASEAARPALERCISHAVAALQVAETQSMKLAERDELALAWRELLKHGDNWCAQYPAVLLAAFTTKSPGATPPSGQLLTPRAPRPDQSRDPVADMFSLVDDAKVEDDIESARLLQQVLPVVEQSLAELDALMSSAQGLVNVSPEFNPVRPDVFAQTLRDLIAGTTSEPAISAMWIKHLAEPLGRELKQLYERLINLLELSQVTPASYRVLQNPVTVAKAKGGTTVSASASSASGQDASAKSRGGAVGYASDESPTRNPHPYADLSNYEIRDELFQDFLFRGGGNADHGLAPSYYATIEEELTALKATPDSAPAPLHDSRPAAEPGDYKGTRSDPQREALPAGDFADEDTPSRIVDVLSQLSSQVWGVYGRARERALVRTQLKKDATRVGQVLGMEVVRKLVNQVAQDPRLLAPVREAIVALEPSLLRLAMVDPRFFSDAQHPGRRLMERVAQRSFKYNDEFGTPFEAFFQAVSQGFNALNTQTIEDARPFEAELGTLELLWQSQDRQEQTQRSAIRQTMQFAEERQSQADQIAYDMSMRADLDHVPGVVLDFLFGPWALVLAHARLTDQARQIDPEGYGSLVTDLLWSVKRDVTLKRPAKLIEMIPGMLGKLHAGLASLGQDPRETESFFKAMEKLHRPVLKLRRVRSRRDAAESEPAPLEVMLEEAPVEETDLSDLLPATAEQRKAKVAGQPWLTPQELDNAGFEDTMPSGPAELNEEHSEDTVQPPAETENPEEGPTAQAKPGAEQVLLSLREGSWVDLHSKRRWLRAQLIWASTRGTLFMFVSHGGQPHSMTKRICERLITQGLLRAVNTEGVVDHALDALRAQSEAPAEPVSRV